MTDWNQRLRDKIAGMPSSIAKAKVIYAGPIGRWIDRYAGGLPKGLAAAHVYFETGGDLANEGDPGLGEYGPMSVTASFPPSIGMPADSRYNPEVNIFLGCTEAQVNAIKLSVAIPEVELGTSDSWKLAHLAFVIGFGGTVSNVKAARDAGYIHAGKVYSGLCDWVRARGGSGITAGSQEPAKVGYRILVVQVRWDVGQAVVADPGNVPRLPPDPPGYHYQIPFGLQPFFHLASRSSILPWIALAFAGAYLYRRMRR